MMVLEQAIKDVAERESTYGKPSVNHARIARLWAAYQSCKANRDVVAPIDSVMFQLLTNIARLIETPNNKEAWDNIAGYAGIGWEVS
jgi:hypothetical protein